MNDAREEKQMAFLSALNRGGGTVEAADYLDTGADINAAIVPIIEQGLLHHAAIHRRLDLIEMLARRGANFDVQDALGMTPMHLAVQHEVDAMLKWQEPDFPCARKLLKLGASPDIVDKQGRKPRELAALYGPLMLDLFDEVMTYE